MSWSRPPALSTTFSTTALVLSSATFPPYPGACYLSNSALIVGPNEKSNRTTDCKADRLAGIHANCLTNSSPSNFSSRFGYLWRPFYSRINCQRSTYF